MDDRKLSVGPLGFYRDALGLELLEDTPEHAYYAAGAHGRVLVTDLDASSEQAWMTGVTLDGPFVASAAGRILPR